MDMNDLEHTGELRLDFTKLAKITCDVIPAVAQDINSGAVLMIGYVNDEALAEMLKTRELVFYSTSRNTLWHKGKTSGEVYDVHEIYVNCEQNSLLVKASPKQSGGGICHVKNPQGVPYESCYYRKLNMDDSTLETME